MTNSNESMAEIEKMYATGGENNSISPEPGKKPKGPRVFLTIILILIIVLVALLIISKATNWNILGLSKSSTTGPLGEELTEASNWQAIFLTNGQVYFGKLKNIKSDYSTLEDIYYLQVQNVPIQPAAAAEVGGEGVQPAEQVQQQLILIKFGTELHRPMDKMYINKDHILLYEDLSQSSAVVQAIEDYKNQDTAAASVPVE